MSGNSKFSALARLGRSAALRDDFYKIASLAKFSSRRAFARDPMGDGIEAILILI